MTDLEVSRSELRHGPACRRCRSRHVRRSSPHSAWERLVRGVGVRFHVCGDCGARGWHLGAQRSRRRSDPAPDLVSGRMAKDQRRRARVIRTLLLALLLGIASAMWLHRCEGRTATPAAADL